MPTPRIVPLLLLAVIVLAAPAFPQQPPPPAGTSVAAKEITILSREQAGGLMPATVFFRGQTASIQARNSTGLRQPDGPLLLIAMVDSSGYSSALQQKYQAYLLTEFPIILGGSALAPGAYGIGFVQGDRLVVMDVGGHELIHPSTMHDAHLARPNPLQIITDPSSGNRFRLYSGRNYVTIEPDSAPHQ